MDGKILKQIYAEIKHMTKIEGLDPKKIFLKLNENIFERKMFILDKISVFYGNTGNKPYKLIYMRRY